MAKSCSKEPVLWSLSYPVQMLPCETLNYQTVRAEIKFQEMKVMYRIIKLINSVLSPEEPKALRKLTDISQGSG